MDRGFISLHRKILENPISNDFELFGIFIYLLLRANHQKTKFIWNGVEQSLDRGEVLTGRKIIAKHFNTTESKIFRKLKVLEKLNLIFAKSNNKFSIISIVKYNQYQNTNTKVNNKRTTSEQQVNTYNNYNNNNNKNKKQEGAHSHFLKPTINEIIDYWNIKKLNGGNNEAIKFFNYYESNGWRVGRSAMRNWQAAVSNWNTRSKEYSGSNNSQKIENKNKFRRCANCNNYLTDNGICYVPECSQFGIDNRLSDAIKSIMKGDDNERN